MVPLPTPEGPASTSSTTRQFWGSGAADDLGVAEQPLALVAAEPAEPTALADVELLHDAARLHLADAGERLEHADDLQLGQGVVARALVEQFAEPERACLELRLHFGAHAARFGRLLQRGLTLLGGERRGQWHPATSGTTAAASIRRQSRLTTGSGRAPGERSGDRARNLDGRVFGVVGAGHRAADHEPVRPAGDRVVGRVDARLVVCLATREPDAGDHRAQSVRARDVDV